MNSPSEFSDCINVHSKVLKDGFSLSVFAVFDLLLIALMFAMMSSKFILPTGVVLNLQGAITLPEAGASALSSEFAADSVSVLNLREGGMIIFDGKIYTLESFAELMRGYSPRAETLLVKADKGVPSSALIGLASSAKSAGFKKIMLAARPK
ncbi:MAG: biopolymer transporter ExbD [Opitutales bacterium]|nr:biopolymer transporter ExbD [Opitutales bacterium]